MKIRAAVLEQFASPLVVREVDLDEPRAGEVLVRLVACGVCHTDLYTAPGADPSGYAPTVLGHWGIASTADLGRMVFTLIDVGLLARQPSDKPEDFDRVYDFAEVFRAGYPWPGVERG